MGFLASLGFALGGCGGDGDGESASPHPDVVPSHVGPYDLVETAKDADLQEYGPTNTIRAAYEGGAGTTVLAHVGDTGSEGDAVLKEVANNLKQSGWAASDPSELRDENAGGEPVGIAVVMGEGPWLDGDQAVIWTIRDRVLTSRSSSVMAAGDFYHSYNELWLGWSPSQWKAP